MNYYIYHIPNFIHKDGSIGKIGCTTKPQRRVNQQTKLKWEILEEHTDIIVASNRERELQKEYGYKVDNSTYIQSVENYKKENVIKAGRVSALKQWKENRELQLEKCKKAGQITAKKYSKIIQQCDLNWNVINTFCSTKQAAKSINGFASTLRGAIVSKGTYKGFKWKYPTPYPQCN